MALIDSTGTAVVQYYYDPWGAPLTVSGTLAATLGVTNPFRYRGYVYDAETGLYYLRSRYYNPAWGRFVNADDATGRFSVLHSHNQFAYCQNNPVVLVDAQGNEPVSISRDVGKCELRPVPTISEKDNHALQEAEFKLPRLGYRFIDAHDVDDFSRSITVVTDETILPQFFPGTTIKLTEKRIKHLEYTYVYRREYDSTFRSRYESMRLNNAAWFDAFGEASIDNIPVLIPYSLAFDLAKLFAWDIVMDNAVKLLALPKDPKKVVYKKASETIKTYYK